ncbi:MAG: alcohol dehydrogenase catalytic domain-containing protein [Candidatus Brockarchaeota archaeon]|nr:alcohol dehydrogenase catalytic domain-containing protein [Candidatus Brockarchaeota archaeon]
MKAAIFYGAGDIRIEERPVPRIGPGELLVKIMAAGICGSDLHAYRHSPKLLEGRMFGHEYSGEVVEVAKGVEGFSVGDRVGLEPLVGCGRCGYCASGSYHLCPSLWHVPGFAEYQKFPKSKAYKLPDHVSFEEASTLDCIAVAVHAAKLSGLRGGETAVVLGAGTIGLLTMQVLKAFGAKAVYETGTHDFQVELARELGADAAINAKKEDLVERIKILTGVEGAGGRETLRGVDHAFETVGGAKSALEEALRIVRRGGTVTVIGDPKNPVMLSSFVMREVKVLGSSSYAYYGKEPEFKVALDLLSSGKVNARRIVTHAFPLERIKEAFDVASDKGTGCVKVVVKP